MNERKAFTVEASKKLSEEFSSQCVNRGYTKYRAIEGALRLWLTLSPEEQVALIEGNTNPKKGNNLQEQIGRILDALDRHAKKFEDNLKICSATSKRRKPKSG